MSGSGVRHLARLPMSARERIVALGTRAMLPIFVELDEFGELLRVVCKRCGTAVAGWVPIADPETRELPDGTLIQTLKMGFRKTAPHAQVIFEMEDGGRHVSAFCRSCAHVLRDGELEDAYLADLETTAFQDEAKGVKQEVVQRLYDYMAGRRPVRNLGIEQEVERPARWRRTLHRLSDRVLGGLRLAQ